MNVLGFDTSTAAVAVAVLRGDGIAAERVPSPAALAARPAHAGELMPAIAAVIDEAGLGFDELDAIAVSRGPGGFTGIRIGLATARGLADAYGTELRGVSSLAALAAGAAEAAGAAGAGAAEAAGPAPVAALLDARRGELFAALYRGGDLLGPPRAVAPEAVATDLEALGEPVLAVGTGAVAARCALEEAGARVPGDDSPLHVVRGIEVCRLALSGPVEPATPLYLRDPDASPLA